MRAAIERALAVLVGLPLWAAGRAGDLHWFHFGERHEHTDDRGRARIVGAHALHVQCPWHLAAGSGIVVASADRAFAAGDDPYARGDGWDEDGPGANRCDERLAAFFAAHTASPPTVRACAADAVGGARFALGEDIVLALFPADSLGSEHWRLFRPASAHHHFVVTGAGIER